MRSSLLTLSLNFDCRSLSLSEAEVNAAANTVAYTSPARQQQINRTIMFNKVFNIRIILCNYVYQDSIKASIMVMIAIRTS